MNTIAIIISILIIVLEIVDMAKNLPQRGLSTFTYYTTLSNFMTLISCIVLLIFGGASKGWLEVQLLGPGGVPGMLRYLASCMMLMTFIITAFVLVPLLGDARKLLFTEGLLHHLICPVLCVVSYVFFERHSHAWPVPVILTLCYGALMLWLNYRRKFDGPYPFFRVHRQGKGATIMWMFIMAAAITVVSLALLAVAK